MKKMLLFIVLVFSLFLTSQSFADNGVCGTNNTGFRAWSTGYSGTFCSTGTPNPINPIFPSLGQTVSWICEGSSGGSDASCKATRKTYVNDSSKVNISTFMTYTKTHTVIDCTIDDLECGFFGIVEYDTISIDGNHMGKIFYGFNGSDDGYFMPLSFFSNYSLYTNYYDSVAGKTIFKGSYFPNDIFVDVSPSGICGTNAISYLSGATNYNGTFCIAGTPSPINPSFPLPGQTINWTCQGSNGGTNANCSATKTPLTMNSSKLKQFVKLPEAPELPQQEILVGSKVGKFQSGTGVILSAHYNNNTNMSIKFQFEVYRLGEQNPIHLFESGDISTGTGKVEVPFNMVGVGEYFWKARVKRSDGAVSSWVDYNTNYLWEYDFAYFSGFEPYPYGYKFDNAGPADGILTGGINSYLDFTPWFYHREKVNGNKWDLFDMAFDTSVFNGNERKKLDAFESVGLDDYKALQGGNCYGMSVSALMQFTHTGFLQTYYPNFSNQVGNGTIWHNISAPSTINQNGNAMWNDYNNVLKTIYALSITQEGSHNKESEKIATTTDGNEILNKYINNPNKKYILMLSNRSFFGDVKSGHVVVPYKYEGNRIYFWDNNIKYGGNTFKQFIEFNSNGTFDIPNYFEYNFSHLALVDIDDIYNGGQKSPPAGFNETDTIFTLLGKADFYLQDSLGRISGFLNGNILEEIPGVNVVIPYNTAGQENNWKKIYLPQNQNLAIKVLGKSNESYNLMISGGNYYTKLEGVTTSLGQLDTYLSTRQNLKIDFDNSKSGNYNLMIDNFYNNGTGTIYMDSMPSIGEKQNYDINWTKVVNSANDSVKYSIDINNDGVYENEQNLPPIHQYIISTMMKTSQPASTLEEESEEK